MIGKLILNTFQNQIETLEECKLLKYHPIKVKNTQNHNIPKLIFLNIFWKILDTFIQIFSKYLKY